MLATSADATGTGKTMLASRAAQLTDACVFVLNGGEFITEITGESEALLKAIFKTARLLQPSVCFFLTMHCFPNMSHCHLRGHVCQERAYPVASYPQIIFFDELDSFAGGRQTGGGPSRAGTATTRLISVLINELDKLQGAPGPPVSSQNNVEQNDSRPVVVSFQTAFNNENALYCFVLQAIRLSY